MGYPAKQFYAAAFAAKEEASFGGGGSLSVSTDAIQLALEGGRAIPVPYKEDFDGTRSYDLAARSPLPQLVPSQRVVEGIELPFSFKGNSSSYSASVKSALHVLFKAAGLDASFGASAWTLVPWAGGSITSLVAALYSGAEKFPLTHLIGSYRYVLEPGKPGMDFFKLWGLLGDPVDDLGGAEALTMVYPSLALDPPKGDAVTIQIGTFLTGDYSKVEFDLGWEDPSPRQLASAAGAHGGFARGMSFNPRLKITWEKTALVGSPFHTTSGLDVYQLRKTAAKLTGSTVLITRGSAANNRHKTIFTQAQVAAPIVQEQNGSVSAVTLELRPYASTPVANDAMSIVLD